MKKVNYVVSCPICGKMLFKCGEVKLMELPCPSCNAKLSIRNMKGPFQYSF